MDNTISKTLKDINKLTTRDKRLEALKENDSKALRAVLKWNFDKSLRALALLPEGTPPYKPAEAAKSNLTNAVNQGVFRQFFRNAYSATLPAIKRESQFVRLLEAVPPAEAELLCKVKDGSLNYIGITKKLCREAFPDLIAE
jgi:hypothetical protein